MGYALSAIVAQSSVFHSPLTWIADSKVIPLAGDISMIPVTEVLHNSLQASQKNPLPGPFPAFAYLSEAMETTLIELSERGVVAYVEAEYAGGAGGQRAIAWLKGRLVLSPLETPGSINEALRLLGVSRQGTQDEFDAVGLGRQRRNEDWLE